MFSLSLVRHSTNLVELTDVEDTTKATADAARYPEVESATLEILAPNRSAIAGADAIPLDIVAGTSGATAIYRAVLPANLPLPVVGSVCPATVTLIDTTGNEREFTGTFTVTPG